MTLVMRLKKRFYFVAAGYFRFFANFALRRWHPRIVAITGSVGKTTMLTLVERELGEKAHYSHDANSAFGIAFDLVGLRGITGSKLRWLYLILAVPIRSLFYRHHEEFYIVEIDGERPHETEFLASWLKPEATLWISLGRSHAIQFENQVASGQFKTIDEAIAHEFSMLPIYTQKTVYIDADNPLMVKIANKIKKEYNSSAKFIKCSKSALKSYKVTEKSSDFVINTTSVNPTSKYLQTSFHFYDPVPKDIATQLVMLQELCNYLEIPLETDFKGLQMPPGRNSYFEGRGDLHLIDSSYNAHLISVESILEMASELKTTKKWLVLGDMVEQGSIEGEEHTKLATAIKKVKPKQVILVGRRTREYTLPILQKAKIPTFSTLEPREALDFIEKNAEAGTTLIFKGSQYLEWIIEKLLKDPADAAKLPRREPAAVKRRSKRGLDS